MVDNKLNAQRINSVFDFIFQKLEKPMVFLPGEIKTHMQEIRISVGAGIRIICPGKTYFLSSNGNFYDYIPENIYSISAEQINNCFQAMCNYSLYSFQEQIKNGFVTLSGGHRVGIAGSAVVRDGIVSNIKNISSLNIRIAKEIKGCSQNIFENIKNCSGGVLIVGPPNCGKTTILRDLARIFSVNGFKKVTIIDERFEIAASNESIVQFDVGFSDVLSGFLKAHGVLIALRSLSPDIIICDEIGSQDDAETFAQALNSGVSVVASLHAKNLNELMNRVQTKKILNSGAFEKIIFLKGASQPGETQNIYTVSDLCAKTGRNSNFAYIRNFRRFGSF